MGAPEAEELAQLVRFLLGDLILRLKIHTEKGQSGVAGLFSQNWECRGKRGPGACSMCETVRDADCRA